jgi:hypothetical protein
MPSDVEALQKNLEWLNEQIAVLERMHQGFELSQIERTAVFAGRSALRTLAIHAEADLKLSGVSPR